MIDNDNHTQSSTELCDELRALESQLTKLTPVALSTDLLGRMSEHVEDSLWSNEAVSSDDGQFDDLEQQLAGLGGAGMSEDLISRMADAMDRWHEDMPVEEKVVAFEPEVSEVASTSEGDYDRVASQSSGGAKWAAAAAVALLGCLSALLFPSFGNDVTGGGLTGLNESQHDFTALSEVSSAPRDVWVVPESMTHKVVNTSEGEVVHSSDNTPYRSVEVEYLSAVKVLDDSGREIEIEQPSVDVMLIPMVTY